MEIAITDKNKKSASIENSIGFALMTMVFY